MYIARGNWHLLFLLCSMLLCAAPFVVAELEEKADVQRTLLQSKRRLPHAKSVTEFASFRRLVDLIDRLEYIGSVKAVVSAVNRSTQTGLVRTHQYSGWTELGCIGGCW
mmetsp:Transcript_41711/g.87322  ORF Transcript_41711/g.87322 Transcript_41711/m.87322 type:complete len:109 (+) Transcript_41711:2-328(+)